MDSRNSISGEENLLLKRVDDLHAGQKGHRYRAASLHRCLLTQPLGLSRVHAAAVESGQKIRVNVGLHRSPAMAWLMTSQPSAVGSLYPISARRSRCRRMRSRTEFAAEGAVGTSLRDRTSKASPARLRIVTLPSFRAASSNSAPLRFMSRTVNSRRRGFAVRTRAFLAAFLDAVFMSDIMTDIAAPFNSSFLRS